MKTLSAQAETNRHLDGQAVLWAFDGTFDQYGLTTLVRHWASRNAVVGAYTYVGLLAEGGVDFGWATVDPRGGLSSISGSTLTIHDEEGESGFADTYVLQNDEVVGYLLFIDGTETAGDRIEIVRAVVEAHRVSGYRWEISLKDGARRLLKKIPTVVLDPVTYPGAYSYGALLPVPFGNLNVGPTDGAGQSPVLAPVRMTDRWALAGTAGQRKKTGSTPYQWYPTAKAFSEVLTYTETANVLDLSNPDRKLILRPARPKTTNDRPTWRQAADGNLASAVAVATGQNLDVWFAGAPKLGVLSAISVVVTATGSYTLTVKDNTSVLYGPTGVSGNQTVALVAATYALWDLALLNVEIDGPGTGSVSVKEIELDLRFADLLAFQEEEPQFYQKVVGWDDQVANYLDGAVITGAGTALRNPVHQLQALFRGKGLTALGTAKIKNGWVAAVASRAAWSFDFVLDSVVDEAWLGDFCFLAGLHLFPEAGGWSVAAMDKTRDPQHFWAGNYHMPVANPQQRPSDWGWQFETAPIDITQILNEIALRFRKHPASGAYQATAVASGQYRLSGTCTLTAAGVLTDASALFVTNLVLIGERLYVSGDQDYYVAGVLGETQLTLTAVGGGSPSVYTVQTAYYLGPDLNGAALLSQLSFKTINALGTQQAKFTDDGGYKVDLIADQATADLLLAHLLEWFSQPRDTLEFPLFLSACNVQLGDVVCLDHPLLRISRRPRLMSTVLGAHSAVTGTLNVAYGKAPLFRVDDRLCFTSSSTGIPEAVRVTALPVSPHDNQLTVSRGQLNTVQQPLAGGEAVYRLEQKFMVTGLQPPTPDAPYMRVRVAQMPFSYRPIGRIVDDTVPVYTAATETQIATSGWFTLANGRVVDLDVNSNVSYVG